MKAPAEAPEAGPEPRGLEVDERLRPLVLACRDAAACAEVAGWPAAWWEQRPGAALVQALLDSEGDEAALPEAALTDLRRLEATVSLRDELPADRPLAQIGAQLEADFVQQEIQALQRQLREPSVQADGRLLQQVEARLTGLLARKSQLQKRLRAGPTRGL